MTKLQARYFLIVLFLIFQNVLPALHSKIDSTSDKKIDSLIDLSGNVWNLNGPFDLNIKWLWEAENIASESENWLRQVECLLRLTTVFNYSGDSDNFNKVVYKSSEVAKKYLKEDHFYFLFIYDNLSDVFRQKRDYTESIEYSEKCIKLCSNCSFSKLAKYYNKISNNYISLGDYAKAKQYLNNAISLKYDENKNDFFQKYNTHSIYSLACNKTEKFTQAIDHLKLSEKYLMRFFIEDYMNELVNIWFDFIEIYLIQDKDIEVAEYLKKIENSNFLEDELTGGKYKISLAKFKYSRDKKITEEIIQLIDEGNKLLKKVEAIDLSLDLRISQNLEFKGDIYFDHKLYNKALASFNETLDKLGYSEIIHEAAKVDNKAIVLRVLSKKLEIHLIENNLVEAKEIESAILNLIRYLRIENSSASTLDYWANQNLKVIEQIIEYNFQSGNFSKVYSLIEENKSNNLVQDISESESIGYANIAKEKIEEGLRVKSELAYCRKKIFEIKQSDSIDSIPLNHWIAEESRLQIELDSYLRNLEIEYTEYYKLKYDLRAYGIKNTQRQLDKHSVLIEYFIGSEKGYLAYVTKNDLEILEISNLESLQELTLDYYLNLQNKSNEFENISKRLFEALGLAKLKNINPDAKDLFVIADDFLNNIPFETLMDESGSLLLDRYDIQYQYSARLWELMKSRKTGKKSYDLVSYAFDNDQKTYADNRSCFNLDNAANLKCAEKEVRSAIEILNNKKILNIEQNILELFASAADTRILHLATHACLDNTESDYSRIYFHDTLLTNQDLKLKDFSADLVVLSACETGFGEVVKGEGSMSLAKGFFHAGAKSTLVSLWPVDDCATSGLMAYFYENIKEGQSKDEALRNAKISYRKYANPEKTHPYYWAGFIVIGDCTPIWNNANPISYILVGLFAVSLLLLLLKLYKTRKFLV